MDKFEKKSIKRIEWLGGIFFFLIIVILFRSFLFQVLQREPWRTIAPSQYQYRIKLIANRGVLYDRDMNILAMDMPVSSLAIDSRYIDDFDITAEKLSAALNQDKEFFLNILKENQDKSFVRVLKEISSRQKRLLLKSNIKGVIIINDRKRVKPFGGLAYQVLGITNAKHIGTWGVEQSFDDVLRGDDGWAIYQKNGPGKDYFTCPEYPVKPSKNGRDIVLTLNHTYQEIIEEELSRGVVKHDAKYGIAVLMNPYTGEILAMASINGDKLKNKKVDFKEEIKNRAVQSTYEPGSVFKIVTSSAAIEENTFSPKTLIYCENGKFRVANQTINDHDKKYTWLTLSQVVEKSSNIGISKVGIKLGKKTFYKYIRDFGFGNRTGVRLPGEASGILRPIYNWSDFSTSAISFGQELSATPLQLACMMSAVANGGELLKPYIVQEILDDRGECQKHFSMEVLRRVISRETSKKIKEILRKTVKDGSGYRAGVKSLNIAGKTGTAQKSISGYKGYVPGAYVSSFVGFWPTEVPRFVLVVMLDEPKKNYWGGSSSAPIFSNAASRISGISPEPELRENRNQDGNDNKNKFVFSSLEVNQAINQSSSASANAERNNNVSSLFHMPDLKGLSVREALKKAADYDITVKVRGNGVVTGQIPEPGDKINNKTVCQLVCNTRFEAAL